MKKLLSFPINLAKTFKSLDKSYASTDWFCTSDPTDKRLGSGAGTAWLLDRWENSTLDDDISDKKIIIHAGGQSRRLPAYASVGKLLTPLPVFRWAVGQDIDQNLLSLQLPLYEQIMQATPPQLNTLIASGDVLIRSNAPIDRLPDVDVICFGLWADPQLASHHGVFLSSHDRPDTLDFMLQKPSIESLNKLSSSHYYIMDIGLWILSDRAVNLLRSKSKNANGAYQFYDLYSQFGCALGVNPSSPDADLAELTTAIIPLPEGEFYHFGTSRELLSSTLALQNIVVDQRLIHLRNTKPNPALFTQNSLLHKRLTSENDNVWVENSCVGPNWTMTSDNIITGVPVNNWNLTLPKGICIDISPIGESGFAVRPYGIDDTMAGLTSDTATTYLNAPLAKWLSERNIELADDCDIQNAPLFPVVSDIQKMGIVARWMISEPQLEEGRKTWLDVKRLSANDISAHANLFQLYDQRRNYLRNNIEALAANYENSVFYQINLNNLAEQIVNLNSNLPTPLPTTATPVQRMRNHILRARVQSLRGIDNTAERNAAYTTLREGILATLDNTASVPRVAVQSDQIVWGRSPVRIDMAGGWTDTPPYSILRGGKVINAAIELNSQPPLQVFIKPSADYHIVLRSIDLGATEIIESYEQLTQYNRIGSPFSIPKAALSLAGFAPGFSPEKFDSLRQQLEAFGSGIEITLLSAIPAGSGLGTSSILAATLLGAIGDFCGLAWDTTEICNRTLSLEQLLTSGGGWQDQYGGILPGVKLLQSDPSWLQQPLTNWLPDGLFTDPLYAPCHLLYYTGITRTAKNILNQITDRMLLNDGQQLRLLDSMRAHADMLADAIQRKDFYTYGRLIDTSWQQNQSLDSGTNPPAIEQLIRKISDLTLGCKLPGAGGGGFLYMVAKDPEAAMRIRSILTADAANPRARFVEMTISTTGLQISRS